MLLLQGHFHINSSKSLFARSLLPCKGMYFLEGKRSSTTTDVAISTASNRGRWYSSSPLPPSATSSSSISNEEVSKFSSLSSTWWDVRQNPLISMNPTRIQWILQTLSKHRRTSNFQSTIRKESRSAEVEENERLPLRRLSVLDVGCGGGLLSESLARLGAEVVVAIDPSVEIVDVAKRRRDERIRQRKFQNRSTPTSVPLDGVTDVDYRGGISVEELVKEEEMRYGRNDTQGGRFDAVFVLEVLEHSADPHGLLRAASRLLKRPSPPPEESSSSSSSSSSDAGGLLFVSTLNRTAKSYAMGILGAEYLLRLLPVGTHDWNQFRSPAEVEALVRESAPEQTTMASVDVCGMVARPDPFTHSLRWSLDPHKLDVNWIGAYGFDSGYLPPLVSSPRQ